MVIRVVKTVFLENGVFVPYRKQVVLTKNGEKKWRFTFYPQKQGVALLRARKPTKCENGENPSGKATVCQKHRFRDPDLYFIELMSALQSLYRRHFWLNKILLYITLS